MQGGVIYLSHTESGPAAKAGKLLLSSVISGGGIYPEPIPNPRFLLLLLFGGAKSFTPGVM